MVLKGGREGLVKRAELAGGAEKERGKDSFIVGLFGLDWLFFFFNLAFFIVIKYMQHQMIDEHD